MTRDDVIKAMANAMHKDDNHCDASRLMDCEAQEAYRSHASLSLNAVEALGVRLVPVEPTEEMLNNGDSMMPQIAKGEDISTGYDALRAAWPAMLLASPLHPNEERSDDDQPQGKSLA